MSPSSPEQPDPQDEDELRTVQLSVPIPGEESDPSPEDLSPDELRTVQLSVPIPPAGDADGGEEEEGETLAPGGPRDLEEDDDEEGETLAPRGGLEFGADLPTIKTGGGRSFLNERTLGEVGPENMRTVKTGDPRFGLAPAGPEAGFTEELTLDEAPGAVAQTIKTDARGNPLEDSGPPPDSDPGSGSSKSALRSAGAKRSQRLEEGETYAGKYELLNEIARGGMGVVYRARQIDLNRMVALKVMLAGNYASEDDRRRFVLEAEASARLKHPNIVPVYEIGEIEGNLYFTMDYVDGEPLSRRAVELEPEKLLEVMIQVCSGVAYAHQRGIIHRDLKPQNVMMTQEDVPLIMDFGLAKQVEITDEEGRPDSRTREGQVMGTPHYMPPEQAEGMISEIDVRSDVWSLGVILYKLYTKDLPFKGRSMTDLMMRIFDTDPTPPRQIDPTIDPDLEAIILKALEKPKDKRYESAGALEQDLRNLREGLPVSARRATNLYRFQKWAKRNKTGLLVGAAFALAVLVLGGFGVFQYRESQRQREAAERERVDGVVDDYLAAVQGVATGQKEFELQRAAAQQEVEELFAGKGAWDARQEPAAKLRERVAGLASKASGLGEGLLRFRGAQELELRPDHEKHEAVGAARDEAERLSGARTQARVELDQLGQRLGRLRQAQGLLSEAVAAKASLNALSQGAASEMSAGDGSGKGRTWSDLASANAHYREAGMSFDVGADASADALPKSAAFLAAADAQRQRLFQILSLAEAGSPEQAMAREGLSALQVCERTVAQARERQADERLAARAAAECRALLDLLKRAASEGEQAGKKEGKKRTKPEQRLQGARLAQAIAQRGLEAPLEPERLAKLRDQHAEASFRYAEVLLELRAYPIYLAEVSHRSAYREQDLATLEGRYQAAMRNRASLESRFQELGASIAQQPLDVLSARLSELMSVERDVRGEAALERTFQELERALRSARNERAIQDLEAVLGRARGETNQADEAERERRLSALVQCWRQVEAKSKELQKLLPPGRAARASEEARLAIGTLYLEQATRAGSNAALAKQNAKLAIDELKGLEKGKRLLGDAESLVAQLSRAASAPDGTVLIRGLEVRLGGGGGDRNEPRKVEVEPFYLGVNEVTNDEYYAFVASGQAGEVKTPHGWENGKPRPGTGDLPVTGVTYAEAKAYAASKGLRLPTDAEWEYAARLQEKGGFQPFPQRAFPWGNAWEEGALSSRLLPPGSRPLDKNARGVYDLAGNVSEWVTFGAEPAARGASYLYPFERIAQAGHRLRPRADYRGPQLGFRLAQDATRTQ